MKRWGLFILIILCTLIGVVAGSWITLRWLDERTNYSSIMERQRVALTANKGFDSAQSVAGGSNFKIAASQVTPSVVHIRIGFGPGSFSLNPLDHYFNIPSRSSGSGVIVSDDGYIVTNHHVIEEASTIEVVMYNNQRFFAKVIGKDPSTDLALLKIKSANLPFVKYGNSDETSPGDWVLAIGNPFDLNSTVTAGIISAKARNIGILRDRNNLQVESFIQTDAAINPGNSGGALVNLRGELIGINSAIATSTGSYSGYSFAIPVNLVQKVMDDLLEFGEVQRGLLGVQINDVDADLAEEKDLSLISGVYVRQVNKGSAAEACGIKAGDVLTAIDGHLVNNVSELQERIARNRPGEQVTVTYWRERKEFNVKAILKNIEGSTEAVRPLIDFNIEGAELEDLSYKELSKLQLEGGVLIKRLEPGKWQKAGIRENFIIEFVDKVQVDNVADLNRILEGKRKGMLVEGVYKGGDRGIYGVDW